MMHVSPLSKSSLLSDSSYNKLKLTVTTMLPGLSTLYFTLAQIWSFPKAEEVVGTIAAVNVFLGLFLQLASRSYNRSEAKYDGSVEVRSLDDGPTQLEFDLTTKPEDLKKQGSITFKINDT